MADIDIAERAKNVRAFIDKAYDADFDKRMSPQIAADVSAVLDEIERLRALARCPRCHCETPCGLCSECEKGVDGRQRAAWEIERVKLTNEIDRLRAKNERVRSLVDSQLEGYIEKLEREVLDRGLEINKFILRIEKLEAALRFYADKQTYELNCAHVSTSAYTGTGGGILPGTYFDRAIDHDMGRKAREALEGK